MTQVVVLVVVLGDRTLQFLFSDFFFINMYIYIYIWSLCFVFLRASVTELHDISRFRKTGTARSCRLEEKKRFLWIPRHHFSETFQSDSSARGPAALRGVTLRVKRQGCEWIVATVLSCGLKKHTQSPIKLGEQLSVLLAILAQQRD